MISETKLVDWSDFKIRIFSDLFANGPFVRGQFLFRGQGSDSWKLSSTFDRWYRGDKDKKNKVADELYKQFVKECEPEDIPDIARGNSATMLSLAQHNGLPTRLVDWSESPYVAAFFAFSGHLRHGLNLEKYIAVWALDTRSHIWNSQDGCAIVEVPSFGNERIRNQYGKFTHLTGPFDSLEEYVTRWSSPDALRKYLVPVRDVVTAMADLDSMGINHARIYPGISGNAKAAEVRVLMTLLNTNPPPPPSP